uniref:hypothetical protein n=1 Tax=uncultured Sphingomonas sp. TaxID=158754 RepID=UPI0025F3F323|nr:hypothetical protein [uncultured Sphingomonas sp.]
MDPLPDTIDLGATAPAARDGHVDAMLDRAVAAMRPGWVVSRDCALAGGGAGAAVERVRYALLHPQVGIALLDIVPGPTAPHAADRVRRMLDGAGLAAAHGGIPPVVYLCMPARALFDLGAVLDLEFAGRPSPRPPLGDAAWVATALRVLTAQSPRSAPAGPPFSEQPSPASPRARWLAGSQRKRGGESLGGVRLLAAFWGLLALTFGGGALLLQQLGPPKAPAVAAGGDRTAPEPGRRDFAASTASDIPFAANRLPAPDGARRPTSPTGSALAPEFREEAGAAPVSLPAVALGRLDAAGPQGATAGLDDAEPVEASPEDEPLWSAWGLVPPAAVDSLLGADVPATTPASDPGAEVADGAPMPQPVEMGVLPPAAAPSPPRSDAAAGAASPPTDVPAALAGTTQGGAGTAEIGPAPLATGIARTSGAAHAEDGGAGSGDAGPAPTSAGGRIDGAPATAGTLDPRASTVADSIGDREGGAIPGVVDPAASGPDPAEGAPVPGNGSSGMAASAEAAPVPASALAEPAVAGVAPEATIPTASAVPAATATSEVPVATVGPDAAEVAAEPRAAGLDAPLVSGPDDPLPAQTTAPSSISALPVTPDVSAAAGAGAQTPEPPPPAAATRSIDAPYLAAPATATVPNAPAAGSEPPEPPLVASSVPSLSPAWPPSPPGTDEAAGPRPGDVQGTVGAGPTVAPAAPEPTQTASAEETPAPPPAIAASHAPDQSGTPTPEQLTAPVPLPGLRERGAADFGEAAGTAATASRPVESASAVSNGIEDSTDAPHAPEPPADMTRSGSQTMAASAPTIVPPSPSRPYAASVPRDGMQPQTRPQVPGEAPGAKRARQQRLPAETAAVRAAARPPAQAPASPTMDGRCRAIALKVQLGEELPMADRSFLRSGCR